MSPNRRKVALEAARSAYEVRRCAKLPLDGPCCVYDLVERGGVEIRFADLPSMEGVYYAAKPAIILSALRPPGRQAFTCAHEFGHHIYSHGEQFDELVEDRQTARKYDQKEFIADCFAGALLMPKSAVLKGLAERSLHAKNIQAHELYPLASWLGVGYTALLYHMHRVLRILSDDQLSSLEKVRLPAIRETLLGFGCSEHLIVADRAWFGRSIDAQVSDLVLLPPDAHVEGNFLEVLQRDSKACIARAVRPGVGRVTHPGTAWVHFARVSKKDFVGLARFRHLEEVQDE